MLRLATPHASNHQPGVRCVGRCTGGCCTLALLRYVVSCMCCECRDSWLAPMARPKQQAAAPELHQEVWGAYALVVEGCWCCNPACPCRVVGLLGVSLGGGGDVVVDVSMIAESITTVCFAAQRSLGACPRAVLVLWEQHKTHPSSLPFPVLQGPVSWQGWQAECVSGIPKHDCGGLAVVQCGAPHVVVQWCAWFLGPGVVV